MEQQYIPLFYGGNIDKLMELLRKLRNTASVKLIFAIFNNILSANSQIRYKFVKDGLLKTVILDQNMNLKEKVRLSIVCCKSQVLAFFPFSDLETIIFKMFKEINQQNYEFQLVFNSFQFLNLYFKNIDLVKSFFQVQLFQFLHCKKISYPEQILLQINQLGNSLIKVISDSRKK